MQHAEDLESLETLHALCNLTQTIRKPPPFSPYFVPHHQHLSSDVE